VSELRGCTMRRLESFPLSELRSGEDDALELGVVLLRFVLVLVDWSEAGRRGRSAYEVEIR